MGANVDSLSAVGKRAWGQRVYENEPPCHKTTGLAPPLPVFVPEMCLEGSEEWEIKKDTFVILTCVSLLSS